MKGVCKSLWNTVIDHLNPYLQNIVTPRGSVWGLTLCLLIPTIPSVGLAQNATRYKRFLSHEDSVAIAAASALADTGRMMPGLRNLQAYNTPGYCLALTNSVERTIWRSGERDTMKAGPSDSLPTAVRTKGAQCIANMRPENVPEAELYNLLEVSARVGDTARMRSVVEHYLKLPNVSLERRILFVADAGDFAKSKARPIQFPFMASMLNLLKTFGAASLEQTDRLYQAVSGEADQRFDTTAMIRAQADRRAYLASFTEEERKKAKIDLRTIIYKDSLTLVTLKQEPDWIAQRKRFVDVVYENDPLSRKVYGEMFPSYVGKLPSDMELAGAFPKGASAVPEKGKVTIYFTAQTIGGRTTLEAPYAVLRRLYERYHAKGLEIAIVTGIQGFMWYSPPLTPEQEAPLHAWYFREYHNLPFMVLVNKREITKMDDGRLVRQRTLWERFYEDGAWRNRGYIVGKDGTVQVVDLGNYTAEEETAAFIERELRK